MPQVPHQNMETNNAGVPTLQRGEMQVVEEPHLVPRGVSPTLPSSHIVNHPLHKLSVQGESNFLMYPQISTSQFLFAKAVPSTWNVFLLTLTSTSCL